MLPLRELQLSFFRSLASSPGASTGFDPLLVAHVESSPTLAPEERINIYTQMYFARLVDVLSQNFPRVFDLLGFEQFQEVVRAYVSEYPSVYPTIQDVGQHLAGFLATYQDKTSQAEKIHPVIVDLAQLEWLRLEVFDAPDAQLLRLEQLQTIAPDDWPTLHFQFIPASQLFSSAWPVQRVWSATEEPTLTLDDLQPQATTLRVWRKDFLIYQAPVEGTEKIAFEAVAAGASFAEVCAALEEECSAETAAQEMGSVLLRWIEDGILAQV